MGFTVFLLPSFQTSNQHEYVASWPMIGRAMHTSRGTNTKMDHGCSCKHTRKTAKRRTRSTTIQLEIDSWVEWTDENSHLHEFGSSIANESTHPSYLLRCAVEMSSPTLCLAVLSSPFAPPNKTRFRLDSPLLPLHVYSNITAKSSYSIFLS